MAQVEFVATFATIFRLYRCNPVVEDGETMAQAKERLKDVLQDSQPRLTLQMNRPRAVKLKWTKR